MKLKFENTIDLDGYLFIKKVEDKGEKVVRVNNIK